MNVEVCSSIMAVKYAFKYVYKGHDKQVIHLSSDDAEPVINEIKRYQNACYIFPPEAMWRIYGFPVANMNPVVVPLQVHLPDQQQVRFAEDADLTRIIERERDKRSMLTKVAIVRGLIENDESLSLCLSEATLFSFPLALRRLFATILTFCAPGDVRKLWDDHYEGLFEDYRYRVCNAAQVRNKVLHDIRVFLRSLGKDLSDFDITELNTKVDSDSFNVREVEDEYAVVVDEEHLCARYCLNADQKAAYDEIIRYVNNNDSGVFFIDGSGGTGKTYLYNALLAEVRSRSSVALATASSGAVANNLPGGRTTHSRFKIPLNVDKKSFCSIKKQSGTAKLIICDEASMAKRHAIEDVDRTMQDIMGIHVHLEVRL
ncbi:ATP-dependent DNA helicase PIF1-like protein [Tanacetum coccineum]